ncbi:Hypothetical Protein FCC1311_100542 [Hondaea fermentalgiana]|uniref:Uncharacterized protein n=1 Tax=Hondaea fermentalgiana TaxID=2315210 RepID=A0A2R5GZD0_9STRA|nr:Hypothetical Protein FCC1311_100542 [Hondaea fermentalgiana]|eukprot:GBG33831.1 Hypothetical Protein FCC1311_100542 [Hondaea fermentalgiana]
MGRAERRSGRGDEDDERLKRSSRRKAKSPTKSPKSSGTASSVGKRRKPVGGKRPGAGASRFVPGLADLAADFRVDPAGTSKRVCKKVAFYVWLVAVLLAILSILGFEVNPFAGASSAADRSDGGIMDAVVPGFLRGQQADVASNHAAGGGGGGADDDEDGGAEGGANAAAEDPEAIPEQVFDSKKPIKLNKQKEKELACKMEDCITSCNKKITAKCAAKKSCKTDREKICRKRCMKARCEERCKDEPHYGYVEREQKMDKCKEGCQGNTAQHNKCIKACHASFQPCKSRCHQVSNRYKCDRVDDSAPPPPPEEDDEPLPDIDASSAGDDDEDGSSDSSSGGGAASFDDFDDEVI